MLFSITTFTLIITLLVSTRVCFLTESVKCWVSELPNLSFYSDLWQDDSVWPCLLFSLHPSLPSPFRQNLAQVSHLLWGCSQKRSEKVIIILLLWMINSTNSVTIDISIWVKLVDWDIDFAIIDEYLFFSVTFIKVKHSMPGLSDVQSGLLTVNVTTGKELSSCGTDTQGLYLSLNNCQSCSCQARASLLCTLQPLWVAVH